VPSVNGHTGLGLVRSIDRTRLSVVLTTSRLSSVIISASSKKEDVVDGFGSVVPENVGEVS